MAFAWRGSANGGTLLLGSGLAGRGVGSATGTKISTTMSSSASYTEAQTSRTFTLTLNTTHPVGTFADGNKFVVTTSAGSVTASNPASAETNSYVANGIMKDAWYGDDGDGVGQGWEEMAGVSFNSTNLTYNSAKNKAPGVHSNGPIAWNAGDEFSLTVCLRDPAATTPSTWGLVDTYITITFLPEAPPVGTYMPAKTQLAPKTLFNSSDLDLTVLPSLAIGATLAETPASSLAKVPHDLARFGASGGDQRRLRMDIQYGTSLTNYDAQSCGAYGTALMQLMRDDISTTDRDNLLALVLKHGIDVYGAAKRGYYGNSSVAGGAGQSDNGEMWAWATAFLLQNTDMLAEAKLMRSMMRAQSYWGTSSWTGKAVSENQNGRRAAQTYFDEMINWPFTAPDFIGSNKDTDYGVIGKAANWQLLPVAALQNSPNALTGAEENLEGGAFDETNSAWGASAIALMCRYRHWAPWHMGAYDPGQKWRDLFDALWPSTGLTKWVGDNPDQLEIDSIDITTPADGQIGFSIVGEDYSNGTTPDRQDFHHSLDGIQWIEQTGVGTSGTITGLRNGMLHYYGMRQAVTANGAAGVGPWSANFNFPGEADRATVTTTGTESAAPAFDGTDPVVCAQNYPAWWANPNNYGPAPASLTDDQVYLVAGLGYPSGNFTLAHYSFQWKRDGADISGATTQFRDRVKADAGKDLSCVVTIDNGVDPAVSHTTTAVTAPALNVLASTKLISTDFAPTFIVDYEDEWLAATVSSADLLHLPGYVADNDVVHSTGGLHLKKTSTYPSFRLPCQNTAVAGTTYTVTAQVVHSGTANANPSFNVINGAGSSVLTGGSITIVRDTSIGDQVENITAEIVVAGGETDLDFRVQLAGGSSSGGTGGGSPYLTNIDITAV